MKTKLLTKEEIARELSGTDETLSIRSVERYINHAGVKPEVKGIGRGKQSQYSRADVDKIKEAYRTAAENREQQTSALTTTKPASLAPVALVAELLTRNLEGFESLSAALDTCPVWLTRTEALEHTGLPATWFDAAVTAKALQYVGQGRGRRYHRADVRALAERMKDNDFFASLLKPKAKEKSPKR
jgi:hypothetical protein